MSHRLTVLVLVFVLAGCGDDKAELLREAREYCEQEYEEAIEDTGVIALIRTPSGRAEFMNECIEANS